MVVPCVKCGGRLFEPSKVYVGDTGVTMVDRCMKCGDPRYTFKKPIVIKSAAALKCSIHKI